MSHGSTLLRNGSMRPSTKQKRSTTHVVDLSWILPDARDAYLPFSSFFCSFGSSIWPGFFSSFLSFVSSPYTRTWPPFFSSFLSFFSSPANEGALKEIATATAIIANNMRFIMCHLPWFVRCALPWALGGFEQAWCPMASVIRHYKNQ